VALEASRQLTLRCPGLRVAGVHDGYFDKAPGSADNARVVRDINASGADILLVSFGMPLQERWLMENWDVLRVNIALPGGGALDYVSGSLRRPPRWLRAIGLEWLGRFILEPRRLWKRYFIGNPLFMFRVAKTVVTDRWNRRCGSGGAS